jgi:ferredoxin
MSVHVIIHNNEGQEVTRFAGEETKTFFQMAKAAWIDLPISCGVWVCGFCRSKIIAGEEYIDIGKKSMPMKDLEKNELFICVGGILSSALTDDEEHEIILQVRL